ncbi:glycerol-3-phosphate acyltransferase [Nannocystis pusilla]|uniref:Glycerol-3-phosphate acyltransferase n=1 Tax=Nannocystis pusilla TaxID=889268 RepID=A0A9X3EUD8_9BACT|nr:glycerol-3-phosphate acyltransferase [Nannocystis pusilla]MCY1010342.1 glycerol-3-phosphate acyltransferase [Nannocystis pusilla]
MALSVLGWCLFAYLIAAIPMGVVVGYLRGVDIRQLGSGNIGATNASRVLGAKWGLVVFALDVFKAYLPVRMAMESGLGDLPDAPSALAWVGLAATLGHIFPVYLGFRGGKGVACALGVFSALLPLAGLIAAVIYVQTLALTRVSAIGSLTAVNAAALHILITDAPPAYKGLVVAIAALIWVRHRGNLRELSRSRRSPP